MLLNTINFCSHLLGELAFGSLAVNIIKEIGYIDIHFADISLCIQEELCGFIRGSAFGKTSSGQIRPFEV